MGADMGRACGLVGVRWACAGAGAWACGHAGKVGMCGQAGGRVWGRAWEGRGKGVRADGRKVGVVRGVGVGWAAGHAGMYYYLSN